MIRLEDVITMKIYSRKNFQSSMMPLDHLRSENNENYQTMYYENISNNPVSEFEDEQDVKIWIPRV